MVLQVYADPCTVNSHKVLAGLGAIGTEYNFNHIDYFTGEQKSESYKKINPFATVPALIDGDLILTESNAILQYAAELAGNKLYPTDLKVRADVNRWLLWEASAWFPCCYIYLVEYVVKPLLKAQPDQSIIDAQAPRFHQLAAGLESALSKHKFIASDELSIADIAVAAPMHLWQASRLPLDQYPNITRWWSEIEKVPAWQKTQPAVEKALLPGSTSTSTSNGITDPAETKQVRALVNYTQDPPNTSTELYFYEDPKSSTVHGPGDDPREILVSSGWHRADSFSVDREGFALHDLDTSFTAWEDEEAVQRDFYPEVVEFLKKTVGAARVLVFDHTIRTRANEDKKLTQEDNTSQRAPVKLVHCDYTAESAPVRVRQLLPDEADALLQHRVALLNVWKPIHNPVEENPLAMCDVTSSEPEDFFKLYLRYRERTGENYVMRFDERHKWWYFPGMGTDKVVLLKTYDSETDGRARFVGHTAFEDPETREGARRRESVEIRTIVFF